MRRITLDYLKTDTGLGHRLTLDTVMSQGRGFCSPYIYTNLRPLLPLDTSNRRHVLMLDTTNLSP